MGVSFIVKKDFVCGISQWIYCNWKSSDQVISFSMNSERIQEFDTGTVQICKNIINITYYELSKYISLPLYLTDLIAFN
jgi:hypothetical protein